MWQQVQQQLAGMLPESLFSKRQRRSSASTVPSVPPPCSDLYDLVLDMDWNRAILHCQKQPQDAKFQDGDGLETPLYLACQWNPPLELVQALIQTNPDALLWTSREHADLPLHMICRYGSTNVAVLKEFLIKPATACHATKYGKTPLWVLWEYARPDCMTTTEYNRPWTREQHQQVQEFWGKVELIVEAIATSRQQSWPARGTDDDVLQGNRAGNSSNDNNNNNNNNNNSSKQTVLYKIHALVSMGALGCPCPVLEYICDQYPLQLQTRDESGQLPLHLAVGPTQWHPCGNRKYKPREQDIIQLLLTRYPDAARCRLFSRWDYFDKETGKRTSTRKSVDPLNGRYPLHIALANRHTWEGGVRELFQAAPEMLSVQDPVTLLYPFQLAAIPFRDNLVVDTGTILQLMKQRPDLLTDVSC
jgi:hypothetical protein